MPTLENRITAGEEPYYPVVVCAPDYWKGKKATSSNVRQLRDRRRQHKGSSGNLVVGIGGISKCGKSSLAKKLKDYYHCPIIGNDHFFIAGCQERDPTITSGVYTHWETVLANNTNAFYAALKEMAEEPNEARLVIAEGHLLYHRQDVANLLHVKILLEMSKVGAQERLKVKRPRLILNQGWYDKVMWELWVRQNNLFDSAAPRSYRISGELPPETIEQLVIALIDEHRALLQSNPQSLFRTPFPLDPEKPLAAADAYCFVCKAQFGSDKGKIKTALNYCGHSCHFACLTQYFREYFEKALGIRQAGGKVELLLCPECQAPIDEYWIQECANLHNYKKLTASDDICYQCKHCYEVHWGIRGYHIVQYLCNYCHHSN